MSAKGNILLDLVFLVYNEVSDLESAVDRVSATVVALECRWQVTIADNASTEEIAVLAERLSRDRANVRVVRLDDKGRGRSLRKTWPESQAEYSLYMDVDLSTHLTAVPQAVSLMQDGADIVAGSRFSPHSLTRHCLAGDHFRRTQLYCPRGSWCKAMTGSLRRNCSSWRGTRVWRSARCRELGPRIRERTCIFRRAFWSTCAALLDYGGPRDTKQISGSRVSTPSLPKERRSLEY
jgi:hypothetical protein